MGKYTLNPYKGSVISYCSYCMTYDSTRDIFGPFFVADSIYTERYMNQPTENLAFYEVTCGLLIKYFITK